MPADNAAAFRHHGPSRNIARRQRCVREFKALNRALHFSSPSRRAATEATRQVAAAVPSLMPRPLEVVPAHPCGARGLRTAARRVVPVSVLQQRSACVYQFLCHTVLKFSGDT